MQQRLQQMKQMEFMFPKHIWSMYLQQDITNEFFEDIAWALATGSNRSLFTTGDAGIGKSLLTANVGQITSWIAEAVSGQPIPFTVDGNLKSDITDFIKMLSNGKSYHYYFLDELLAYHGQGSQITMDSMKNIMKASARFEQINWSIVGIELLPMHVYNYVLRAEAKDYDETNIRKSKAFVAELWCLPAGTQISSNPHQIAIEEVKAGDVVLTHDGYYSQIKATAIRPYDGPMVELHTYGRTLKATPNHVLPYIPSPRRFAEYRNQRSHEAVKHADVVWGPIGKIKLGDFVFLPRMRRVVDRRVLKLQQLERVGPHKLIKWKVPLTQNLLKLIGLFVAEGSLGSNSVTLSLGPTEAWIADLAKEWFAEIGIKSRWFFRRHNIVISGTPSKGYIQLTACSAALTEFFKGFYNTKKQKELPTWCLYLPMFKQKALLAGMWMGDGTIIKNDAKDGYLQYILRYTTTSGTLAEQVSTLLMRLGFLPSMLVSPPSPKRTFVGTKALHQVSMTGRQLNDLGKILGGRFAEARGRGQQWKKTRAAFIVPVKAVLTKHYTGSVYDLQVGGDAPHRKGGRPREYERKLKPSYVANGISCHNSKVWEDLYGNYMQIGKLYVPIVLSPQWIDEYHLKQKAPKVASVLREEGLVERQGMQDVYNKLWPNRR